MAKIKYLFGACAMAVGFLFLICASNDVQAGPGGGSAVLLAGKWNIPDSVKKSAGDGAAYIKIFSPTDGDVVPAGKPLIAEYSMYPGPMGDHFHYYIDGEQLGSIRSRAGSLDFGKPKPGKHILTLKIANSAHILIGVEKSVTVTAK